VPGLGAPPLGQVPVPEPPHGRTDGPMGIDGLIHKTTTGSVAAGPWTRPYGRSNAIDHPDGERGSAVPICESSLRCRAQLEGCAGNWAGTRGRQAPLPVSLAPRPQPLALVSKIPYRGMSRLPNPTAQLRAVHSRRLPAQQSIGRRPAPGGNQDEPQPTAALICVRRRASCCRAKRRGGSDGVTVRNREWAEPTAGPANTNGGTQMKPVPIAVVGPLALAGCSGKIESAINVTQAGATSHARLKGILVATVACFALVCASAQAQDLAMNKPASASSTEDNRADLRPELANDGDSSTRWSSNHVDDQWWQVDLGSVREINRVELNWEIAYASQYRIRTRMSPGESWSTAATVSISSPGLKIHSFPARDARFVRIQEDQRATRWGTSLWDAKVFGPASSPPAPVANFSVSPDPAVRNSPTTFTSTGTCPDVPCTYRWFHGPPGGEPIGTGQTASFTYRGPAGERTVELRVTGQANRTASVTKTFDLVDAPPPPDNDADDDGVLDADDQCPNLPGPASNNGCPTLPTGFPNALSTGVPPGTTLIPSAAMTINTAGTVVNARDISGPVVVNAPNVTIRNSRIRTNAFWAIDNNSTGLVVEDTEIDGLNGFGTCFGSSDAIVRRANIHGCENGFNVWPGNLTVEDSYIHDLTTGGSAHTDGAQFGRGAHDIVFRHNTIIAGQGGGSTSCIIMWDGDNPQNTRVRVENNRLIGTGAAWTMYTPRQPASEIYVNNNRWEPGVFGYWNGLRPTEFNGNVDDSSGQPIN
jgi:F5/8 type C domain